MAKDFRTYAFDVVRVDAAAKSVGRDPYWKLYAAENIVRVIVNTVLLGQLGPNWWQLAADPKIQKQAASFSTRYAQTPWYSTQGKHPIYFTFLGDLAEIMRANSNLFLPVIADIDAWIARIVQVNKPRNVIGHMNWPTQNDRNRISVFYSDLRALAVQIAATGTKLEIP